MIADRCPHWPGWLAFGPVGMALLLGAWSTKALGQDAWSTSPYQISVWCDPVPLAADNRPWVRQFEDQLRVALVAALGMPCQVRVRAAPRAMARALQEESRAVAESLTTSTEGTDGDDKWMVVRFKDGPNGFHIVGREFDVRSQVWGPTLTDTTDQVERLAEKAGKLLARCHVPLGRISRVRAAQATVQLRAGLLLQESDPSRLPAVGSAFQVVLRHQDRLGRLTDQGVQPLEWTVLQVQSVAHGSATCQVITGLNHPLHARGTQSIQRLALQVRTPFPGTRLQVTTQPAGSAVPEWYEILWRSPDERTLHLAGRTDWRGGIDLMAADGDLRLLYVKSGQRFLARLPIVVGAERIVTVTLPSDEARLEVEGFLQGIQQRILDVFAERTVLVWRIQQYLKRGDVRTAEKLYQELQDLDTTDDFARLLRDREQQVVGVDRVTRQRIDRLFQETRSFLQKHLASSSIDALGSQIRAARANRS